jgi:Kef-type K+ transport system membrane component KefB
MQLKGARLILGATIVDDILSIAVLSLVTTIVRNRNNDNRDYKYRISSLKDIRIILCIACRRCCTSCVNSFFKRQNRSTKVGTGTI